MPKIKVNSPLFVYNDSHLSLKVQYTDVQMLILFICPFVYIQVFQGRRRGRPVHPWPDHFFGQNRF